jgi:hypothetical protein
MLAGNESELGERATTLVGQRDRVVAAIVRIAGARDEAATLEFVDQGDQPWRVHAERVGEATLTLAGDLPEAAEHAGLGRGELQRPDALGERSGGVGTELREQEGDATIAWVATVVGRSGSHTEQSTDT